MPEGHDTIIVVSNIMSFVLYTQILKQSVLKPASPGITLIKCKLNTYHFEVEENYPIVHPYTCFIDSQHKLHM